MTLDGAYPSDDAATAHEDRILTHGFRLHTVVGLLAIVVFIVVALSGSDLEERAENSGEVVIAAVAAWDVVAIANVAAMYWYVIGRRRRRGLSPHLPLEFRTMWVLGQVTWLSLILCFFMIFLLKGGPPWLLALTIVAAANAVTASVHNSLMVRRIRRNPSLS